MSTLRSSHSSGGEIENSCANWGCRVLVVVCLWLCPREGLAEGGDGANSTASRKAQEYVDQFVLAANRKACQELAEKELEELAKAKPDVTFTGWDQLPAALRETLEKALADGPVQLAKILKGYAEAQDKDVTERTKTWTEIRSARNQLQIDSAEVQATSKTAMHIASLFNLHNRWFWLFSLIAMSVLLVLVWHDNRHELRKIRHGGWAKGMGLSRLLRLAFWGLLAATVVTFLCGDSLYRKVVSLGSTSGESPYEMIDAEIKQEAASEEQQQAYLEAQQSLTKTLDQWVLAVGKALGGTQQQWRDVRVQLRAALLSSSVKLAILEELDRDNKQLLELGRDYDEIIAALTRGRNYQDWIRLTVGVGIIGLTIGGAAHFARRTSRRLRANAAVCPMCLGDNTLKIDPSGSYGDLETVRCSRIVSESPYVECDFSFLSIYQQMTKLYIPTLGHPTSGKTLWLAMLYRELITGNFNAKLKFQKVKSKSSEDFDRLVDEIINSRMAPLGTQTSALSHPLIFDFEDHDRYGKSNVLVSIFDYSGEVTQRMQLNDPIRRRALEADAYLFFCDPTQHKEAQALALVNFAQDVDALRRVHEQRKGPVDGIGRSTRSRRVPVALCVSKIDLLFDEQDPSRVGQGEVNEFYLKLREIDETYEPMSLPLMEARSQLVQRIRDSVWPGWQIEKQIGDLFGGRFLFFPLTPVGLTELGERDLRNRTLEPYAILEPLLWLLHMNGFAVLDPD